MIRTKNPRQSVKTLQMIWSRGINRYRPNHKLTVIFKP